MSLHTFLDELTKIADAGPPAPSKPVPINAVPPTGPRVPTNGLKPPPLPAKAKGLGGMGGALMEGLAGAKGKNPFAAMKLASLLKLAALNAKTILPGSSAGAMKAVQTTVRDVPRLAPMKNVPNEAAVAARFNPPTRPPPSQSGVFSAPPQSARITPSTSPTSNTIPAPAAASSAPTQLPPKLTGVVMRAPPPTGVPDPNAAVTMPPPARMPKFAFAGVLPVATVQPPPAITPQSGRAFAASRAALAGPKKPSMIMKVGEGEDPGHGMPGHDHKASVEKLRAAMKQKHPHLLAKTAAPAWRRALNTGKVTAEDFKKKLDVKSFPAGLKREINNYEAPGTLASGRADYLVRKNVERAEAVKKASVGDMLRRAGTNLVKHEDAHEIAGLATLAVPSIDNIQARLRGGDEHNDKHILPEVAHDAMEVGGLGYLAAPMIAKGRLGAEAVKALHP